MNFTPSLRASLVRWNEIRIAGHKNDYVRLSFQRDRSDIEADSHVYALLAQGGLEIFVAQFADRDTALQKPLLRPFPHHPVSARIPLNLSQPHSKVGLAVQPS